MYKIGTRVRVVEIGPGDAQVLGKEAVIASVHPVPITPFVVYGLDIAPFHEDQDFWYGFLPSQLEPILPSGHAPGIKGTCEPLDKLLSEVIREEVE
jgi:hypothetical protein